MNGLPIKKIDFDLNQSILKLQIKPPELIDL